MSEDKKVIDSTDAIVYPKKVAKVEENVKYASDALAKAAIRRQKRSQRVQGVTPRTPLHRKPTVEKTITPGDALKGLMGGQRSHKKVKTPKPSKKKETPVVRKTKKVGRNEPCSCKSGKKNKKCCNFK